jgi:hypothetical protein
MRHVLLAASIIAAPASAQTETAAVPEISVVRPAPPPGLVLRRDTPIELLAPSEVRSDKAPPGTRFKLRVNKPVQIDGVTVIPVGAMAWGEVISAEGSKGLGKSGAMSARLLHIDHGGRQIPLEGDSSAKGMGAGSAGVAVIFTGIVGLFHRGNNAKIKAGEIMTGFIGADTEFAPPAPAAPAQP